MEVKLVLDEEEEVLVRYYAEVMEMSVEDAFKSVMMERIRDLYQAQADAQPKQKCTYFTDDRDMVDDDFNDEDR